VIQIVFCVPPDYKGQEKSPWVKQGWRLKGRRFKAPEGTIRHVASRIR